MIRIPGGSEIFPRVVGGRAARFDEPTLVSCAGLVPVLELVEQTSLEPLLARVRFTMSKVRSGV